MKVISVGKTNFVCPSCYSELEIEASDLKDFKICTDSGSYCESASYSTVYNAFRCPICKACYQKSGNHFSRVTEY